MTKLLMRKNNRHAAAAMLRWRQTFGTVMDLRQKANTVIMRLAKNGLCMAVKTWQDHTTEERQMKRKALTVAQRVMTGALVSSFGRWVQIVLELIDCRSMERRKKRLIESFRLRRKNKMLSGAMVLWRDLKFQQTQAEFSILQIKYDAHQKSMLELKMLMTKEGQKYNLLKERFKKHGLWIISKLRSVMVAQVFDLFYDKVVTAIEYDILIVCMTTYYRHMRDDIFECLPLFLHFIHDSSGEALTKHLRVEMNCLFT